VLLLLVVTFSALAAPAPALAQDPSMDAALHASEVNDSYCADLYSGKVDVAAGATVAVAEVWQQVSVVYEGTRAPYLLYWRGVLAQCLGRDDAAKADLEAFVRAPGGSSMFADMVRKANGRLRRLGGKARSGHGPSARWLRQPAALEISLRYALGGGASVLACTDDDEPDSGLRVENSGCAGGAASFPQSAGLVEPAFLEGGLSLWSPGPLGLGLRAALEVPVPNGLPLATTPGPSGTIELGPALLFANGEGSGQAAAQLRVEPRLAVFVAESSPWAGTSKYLLRHQHFLDAGTLRLFGLGPSLRLSGTAEVDPSWLLAMEGRAAWFPALPGRVATVVRGPSTVTVRISDGGTPNDPADDSFRDETVEILPDLVSSTRLAAGLRVGLLRAPEDRPVVAGPFLDLAWTRTELRYPDDPGDVWCAAPEGCAGAGDGDLRKVFSTRRDEWVVRAGIELTIGRGAARRSK
jgi:hypothetical protein